MPSAYLIDFLKLSSGGVRSGFLSAIGFNQEQVSQQEEFLRRSSPLNLIGQPADIAELVAYVASESAKYMTGSCIVIDGGSLYGTLNLAN